VRRAGREPRVKLDAEAGSGLKCAVSSLPIDRHQQKLIAMPYCPANGIQLYYEVYGDGPPLVFVHGAGGNHVSWFRQTLAFARSHRVVVYDQRGFGNSKDIEKRGRSAMVDDLAALLDHLKIERTVLVAQSLGGGTCAGFTVREPGRVAGLALCDTLVAMRLPPDIAATMEDVQRRTTGLPQAIRVLGPTTRERHPDMTLLYTQLASFNLYSVGNMPGAFADVEVAALAASGVRILYVVGSDDILYPPDCIRRVQALVPNSALVEIPDVGHSAYFEDAVTFNQHLTAFLEQVGHY
jgi:3-oxoadipate enol-lactonase